MLGAIYGDIYSCTIDTESTGTDKIPVITKSSFSEITLQTLSVKLAK